MGRTENYREMSSCACSEDLFRPVPLDRSFDDVVLAVACSPDQAGILKKCSSA